MTDSDTSERAGQARRTSRPWPLRVYVIGLAIVFLAAAAANLVYQHNSAVDQARQTAEADARFAAAEFGGPMHLQFLVSTADQSRVLARSADPARWVGAPLAHAGVPRLSAHSQQADLGGTPSLYSVATVRGLGWHVVAAIPTARALAAANGASDRQLIITLAGLVLFLAALWVIYRRITRPISRLSAAVRAATSGAAPGALDVHGPAEVADLAEDFTSLIQAAAERRALEERLRRAERAENQERELRLLADRDRIARGLHDTVIRQVFATGLSLASISQSITDREPRRRLEDSIGELDTVARQIRNVVFAAPGGPSGNVRDLVLAVAAGPAAELGFQPSVGFTGPVDSLPAYLADQMLATLRESLAAMAQQGSAHNAEIRVTAGDDLVLVIQHDGTTLDQPGQAGGTGLDAARARAERLGGRFTSQPTDGGTRLEWRIPLPKAAGGGDAAGGGVGAVQQGVGGRTDAG